MSEFKQYTHLTGGNVTYSDSYNEEQTTDELVCKLTKQVAELTSVIDSQKETNLALCNKVAELTAELNQIKEAYDDTLQDIKWTHEDVEQLTTRAEQAEAREKVLRDKIAGVLEGWNGGLADEISKALAGEGKT